MQVTLKSLQYPGSMPVQSTQDGTAKKNLPSFIHEHYNSYTSDLCLPGNYSLRFKLKVTFGHKPRYEIKVTFGEVSFKLCQTNGMLPETMQVLLVMNYRVK